VLTQARAAILLTSDDRQGRGQTRSRCGDQQRGDQDALGLLQSFLPVPAAPVVKPPLAPPPPSATGWAFGTWCRTPGTDFARLGAVARGHWLAITFGVMA